MTGETLAKLRRKPDHLVEHIVRWKYCLLCWEESTPVNFNCISSSIIRHPSVENHQSDTKSEEDESSSRLQLTAPGTRVKCFKMHLIALVAAVFECGHLRWVLVTLRPAAAQAGCAPLVLKFFLLS